MKKLKSPTPLFLAFLQATGIYVYILAIAWLGFNSESFIGNTPSFLMPVFALTLFVASALITSSMAFYYPITLFFIKKRRSEALKIVISTAGFMFFYTIATISIIVYLS